MKINKKDFWDGAIVGTCISTVLLSFWTLCEVGEAKDSSARAERIISSVDAGMIRRVNPPMVKLSVPAEPEEAEGENPAEDGLIELALVDTGYFRADVPLDYELQDVLHTVCESAGVPYELALGVIEVESNFHTDAVNKKSGCYGLMQLNPRYFPSGLSPAENIRAGVGYLGQLIDQYGDVDAALTAYFAGHDTGDRGYAETVFHAAREWEKGPA